MKKLSTPINTFEGLSKSSPSETGAQSNFEELYFQFYPQVKKQVLYNAGPQHVDDLCQEIFFKIHKGLKKFKGHSKIDSWIYRITLNTCYDFLRKKERRFKLFFSLKRSQKAFERDSLPPSGDVKIELQKAVLNLAPLSKSVFTLYYFSNLNLKSISEALNIPEGTVKSRLSKARKQIKKHFEMEEPNGPQ